MWAGRYCARTLIYAEGRDTNITPLSRLIRRFGFMPLVGGHRV